jgi:hypothetical protein
MYVPINEFSRFVLLLLGQALSVYGCVISVFTMYVFDVYTIS